MKLPDISFDFNTLLSSRAGWAGAGCVAGYAIQCAFLHELVLVATAFMYVSMLAGAIVFSLIRYMGVSALKRRSNFSFIRRFFIERYLRKIDPHLAKVLWDETLHVKNHRGILINEWPNHTSVLHRLTRMGVLNHMYTHDRYHVTERGENLIRSNPKCLRIK